MRRPLSYGIFALSLGLFGCGPHQNPSVATASGGNRLASATVTFDTRNDGKDAKSAVEVQLIRTGSELAADARTSGTEFKDDTKSPPIALTVRGPFSPSDMETGYLRLHLTPDGNDTWTFDVRLSLRYADETQQNYAWQSVRLDEKAPERTLVLTGARQP